MALVNEFEKQGNFLFRYRGQFPVLLFLLAVPFLYWTDTASLSDISQHVYFYSAIILSVLGFCIRAYTVATTPKGTSGRNTKEQKAFVLNTTGIYSVVRHPLYLGNYFMWIGIVVFTFNPFFIVFVSFLYCIYYERIMYAEERFLERKFGEDYMIWASSLNAFIPTLKAFKPSLIPFSIKTVLRREYSGVLATTIGFVFVDVIRHYFNHGEWFISPLFLYILLFVSFSALLLRTLKHNTVLLSEEGRS
tara:strand:+ start:1204 stop:1947 length:744 start_codon:yes stop_codon:yes gene_type:complete